jgi:membrane protein YqaA with SNARE-associated domain
MTGGYIGLFLTAFLAATLLPLSSEAVLTALAVADGFDAALLFAVATLGNTLGAVANWGLGRFCLRWADRRWFPFSAVPVVGDPLTFAAGVMRVGFLPFVVLVGLGKGARYAAVLAVAQGVFGS